LNFVFQSSLASIQRPADTCHAGTLQSSNSGPFLKPITDVCTGLLTTLVNTNTNT